MNHSRYSAALISTGAWIHWEIKRHLLETETPGKFGYFNAAEVAK